MSERTRENITLIGLPGSGKSSLGKRVARDFGLGYRDTDELIVEAAGIDIPGIFASRGEAGFRELETEALRRLALTDEEALGGGVIISTGGGAVLRPENVELLRGISKVVFVDRKPRAIARGRGFADGRPLLRGADDLNRLDLERRTFYEASADVVFHNDGSYEAELDRLRSVIILLGACGPLCLIGDPVGHSLSPLLHRVIFGVRSVPGSYRSARVTPKGLETAVNWLREGSLLGMNVTKPHKRAIAPLLDELRGDATLSGAVNTVKKENGRLIGYNTDMEGLAAALASRGRSYRDSIVTIFGAGGAAAGIAAKAAADGASSVNVVCRRPAAEVSSLFPDGVAIIAHDISSGAESAEAANAIESADILINATPLGMSGMTEDFTGFGFLDRLRQGVLVCDLIYEPAETGFLREARKRGHETMNGLPMLIYQGILTDEIVLDLRPDREYLYAEIMSEYSRRQERKRKAT